MEKLNALVLWIQNLLASIFSKVEFNGELAGSIISQIFPAPLN